MATPTVRDIDEAVMPRLRAGVRANNRSVSAEVRHVLATGRPQPRAHPQHDAQR